MKFKIVTLVLFQCSLLAQSSKPSHHFSAPYLFEIYQNGKLSNYRSSMTFSAYRDDNNGIEYVECKYVLIVTNDESKTLEATAHAFSTTDGTITNVALADSVVSFEMHDDIFSPECSIQFVCDKRLDKVRYTIHGIGTCANKLSSGSTMTEWRQVRSIHLPYNTLVRYSLE